MNNTYKVILVDPLLNNSDKNTSAMEYMKSILLPSEEKCYLFMWTRYSMLIPAIELFHAWGFVYNGVAFHWIKMYQNSHKYCVFGGNYTRVNAEIMIMGIKGYTHNDVKAESTCYALGVEDKNIKPACTYGEILQFCRKECLGTPLLVTRDGLLVQFYDCVQINADLSKQPQPYDAYDYACAFDIPENVIQPESETRLQCLFLPDVSLETINRLNFTTCMAKNSLIFIKSDSYELLHLITIMKRLGHEYTTVAFIGYDSEDGNVPTQLYSVFRYSRHTRVKTLVKSHLSQIVDLKRSLSSTMDDMVMDNIDIMFGGTGTYNLGILEETNNEIKLSTTLGEWIPIQERHEYKIKEQNKAKIKKRRAKFRRNQNRKRNRQLIIENSTPTVQFSVSEFTGV
ncbi:MAG: hypothetical protein ACTSUE_16190 [Promethearchaeota archaeon]